MMMPFGFGRPNVSIWNGCVVPGHQDFLGFRIAFRIHANFHRHAESVQILMNLADDLETLSACDK